MLDFTHNVMTFAVTGKVYAYITFNIQAVAAVFTYSTLIISHPPKCVKHMSIDLRMQ